MVGKLKLNTGDHLPQVGLGLWKVEEESAPHLVKEALVAGYRHLDCACDYGNEPQVGEGIASALKEGICRREDLWVTSKLWNTYHARKHVRPALERSLRDLKLDYLDLYMIHFPISLKFVPFEERYPPGWIYDPNAAQPRMEFNPVPIRETWQAMEELVDAGLVRNIGVCNFNTALLRDLLSNARLRPAVLQVELHPYLAQEKLVRFCRENGIAVTAFSPLGAPSYVPLGMAEADESILDESAVRKMAERHGKTPAQILLRWGIQRGIAVIPKTGKTERLLENIAVFDFELSREEMNSLNGLNRNRRFNDPGVFGEKAFNTFCPIFD
jgi:diketogulonate reductase-like aldo/keto reductase